MGDSTEFLMLKEKTSSLSDFSVVLATVIAFALCIA